MSINDIRILGEACSPPQPHLVRIMNNDSTNSKANLTFYDGTFAVQTQ